MTRWPAKGRIFVTDPDSVSYDVSVYHLAWHVGALGGIIDRDDVSHNYVPLCRPLEFSNKQLVKGDSRTVPSLRLCDNCRRRVPARCDVLSMVENIHAQPKPNKNEALLHLRCMEPSPQVSHEEVMSVVDSMEPSASD